MSHTTPLQDIAQSLVAARRSGQPSAIATTHPGLSLDKAYAVQAEVAFRLAQTPTGPQDVLSCLGTVCVSIELIGTRLLDGLNAPAHWKLADQSVHAGLVIGPETPQAACAHFTDEHWRCRPAM